MLLSLVLAIPIFSGLAAYLMRQGGAKGFAALIAAIQTVLAVYLGLTSFPQGMTHIVEWLPQFGLHWSLGLDGANFLLVLLTPIITWLAILATPDDTPNLSAYVASLLLLDGFLSGLFLSQNLGLFYIFFEAMLLPALILIAGWSKVDAGKTAIKFLLYTMVGSLPMLLSILVLFFTGVGGDSLEFSQLALADEKQIFLFYPFLLAFLVKMPIFPLHGWLPTLYKNAPPTVTAVIAALMSKAGTYGLFKVGLVVFPQAFAEVSASLAVLAVASIIYGALTALGSDSVREVLAYSSLSHIAMIAFGMTSLTVGGNAGASLQMAAHAVATGGLFLVVAVMERRHLPDQLRRFGGLAKHCPRLAVLALFLTLASLGQPGLGSFPAELFILAGTWVRFSVLTVVAASAIVLAAAYLLRWYQKLFTGPEGTYRKPEDLDSLESFILTVPIALSLMMGFFPSWFMVPVRLWLEGKL